MNQPRKQLSGAAKRKLKRLKAEHTRSIVANQGTPTPGVLMPPIPSLEDLQSLTGTARESAQCYREWRLGRLTRDDYLTAVRGLAEHRNNLVPAITADQALEIQRQLEELKNQRRLSTFSPSPAEVDNALINGEAA